MLFKSGRSNRWGHRHVFNTTRELTSANGADECLCHRSFGFPLGRQATEFVLLLMSSLSARSMLPGPTGEAEPNNTHTGSSVRTPEPVLGMLLTVSPEIS
jgi:hypothetical protein